jgi:branched-chain amino acid transport system ATP-binding protein
MNMLQLDQVISGSWNRPVNFILQRGEVLLILGRNGVGKTTLLNTIAGLVPICCGKLSFEGNDITPFSEGERVEMGIHIALEGRKGFPRLSVRRNLLLGAFTQRGRQEIENDLEWIIDVFPSLREKLDYPAGTLSGGQQTQLNIARALMGRPKLLLLDEPALGLDPINTRIVISLVERVRIERQVTTIIAEQTGQFIQAFQQRVLLMVGGEILFDGSWAGVAQEKELLSLLR